MTNAPETYSIKASDGTSIHGCRPTKSEAIKLAQIYRGSYIVDTRTGSVIWHAKVRAA